MHGDSDEVRRYGIPAVLDRFSQGFSTVKSRCCRTCRWFDHPNLREAGTCQHPDRLIELGFAPPAFHFSLECRRGWGQDSWEAAPEDFVLDIQVRMPDGEVVPTFAYQSEMSEHEPLIEAPLEDDDVLLSVQTDFDR